MRSARVLRDVAADGGCALAGWIGREIKTLCCELVGEFKIDHSRLHYSALVDQVDLQHLVHAREGEDDAAVARDGAATQSSTCAARDDRYIGAAGQLSD